MTRKGWLVLGLAACAVAFGCKEEESDTTAGGGAGASTGGAGGTSAGGAAGQGGAGTIETRGATVGVACVESDPNVTGCNRSYSTNVAATALDACLYTASSQTLTLGFIQASVGRIDVSIPNFTGNGTYTANADTDVAILGEGLASAATTDPSHTCTIQVTSNFAQVVVPGNGDAPLLDVALAFDCQGLVAGSICLANCTVSPTTFSLSVKGCHVSQ